MSSSPQSCIICGELVFDWKNRSLPSWINQYRAICCDEDRTWVSGVGIYTDDPIHGWRVPSEYGKRWENSRESAMRDITVMHERQSNLPYGFIFHEACWRLLEEYHQPSPVPVARLFEVCKSLTLPLSLDGVSWEHNYGGMHFRDYQNHLPWEQDLEQPASSTLEDVTDRVTESDPFNIACVDAIMSGLSKSHAPLRTVHLSQTGTHGPDCFEKLPTEICTMISIELPTSDVLTLRQVSRAFGFLMFAQTFWKSRFNPDAERGFLFEARKTRKHRDWMSLYHQTNRQPFASEFGNRKRVWGLCQIIARVLALRKNESVEAVPDHKRYLDLDWRDISSHVQAGPDDKMPVQMQEGCHLMHKQRGYLPHPLSTIAVSQIQLGDITYITGLRLMGESGKDLNLGYRNADDETCIPVHDLTGFELAVGPRGIHALKIVDAGARASAASDWIGQPAQQPRTHRLITPGTITALEAGFDGYKLVSLAVGKETLSSLPRPRPLSPDDILRDTGLWFPSPPPTLYSHVSPLSLNAETFTGRSPLDVPGFQPIFWTDFSGPHGLDLVHLRGVRFTVCSGRLHALTFEYGDGATMACRKFGGLDRPGNGVQEEVLAIDGDAGEEIAGIECVLAAVDGDTDSRRYGALAAVRVCTSWGRGLGVRMSGVGGGEGERKVTLRPRAGETITGLYGTEGFGAGYGILSLGIMSRVVGGEGMERNIGEW